MQGHNFDFKSNDIQSLVKKAEQGSIKARQKLYVEYLSGDKAQDTIRTLETMAGQGNIFAASTLGSCYNCGSGIPKDIPLATKYYHIAAEAGDSGAINALGRIYFPKDQGVAQDTIKSLETMITQGSIYPAFLLAENYESGSCIPRDIPLAIKYYHIAADRGNNSAQYTLAKKYHYGKGEGVAKDPLLALKYYQMAAEGGFAKDTSSYAYDLPYLFRDHSKEFRSSSVDILNWLTEMDTKYSHLGIPSNYAYDDFKSCTKNLIDSFTKSQPKEVIQQAKKEQQKQRTGFIGLVTGLSAPNNTLFAKLPPELSLNIPPYASQGGLGINTKNTTLTKIKSDIEAGKESSELQSKSFTDRLAEQGNKQRG